MKLIVLSDIHLMISGEDANDPGNHARLDTAIDRINAAYADADLVVFPGRPGRQGDASETLRGFEGASDAEQTTVHFDNYVDEHSAFIRA